MGLRLYLQLFKIYILFNVRPNCKNRCVKLFSNLFV